MSVLTELVRNIMLIILLTSFLDMIMPSHSMQRFVKVVMGLFVLIAILNPILNLINKEQALAAFVWQEEELYEAQFNSVLEQGEHFQRVNQEILWETYQRKIEKQMETLVLTVDGVEKAEVQVKLDQTVNKECPELFQEVFVLIGVSNKDEEKEGGSEFIQPVKINVGKAIKKQQNTGFLSVEKSEDVLSNEEQLLKVEIVKTISQYLGIKDKQINIGFILQ
mgnify:CR=1 FL=1|jgi:stage III sporulation protein AF